MFLKSSRLFPHRGDFCIALPLILTLYLLSACAGGHLMKIGGTSDEMPKDLPKELQDKFEVREAVLKPTAVPSQPEKSQILSTGALPSAQPTQQNAKAAKKSKKKAKSLVTGGSVPLAAPTTAPSVAAPSTFVYPSRRPPVEPVWLNETLVYDLAYFGVSAGEFTLHVEPFKYVGSRKVYHIRGNAVSSKVFSLFYRLNDMVETFIDFEGLFSHRFHIDLDESKQTRDALELNDSEKGQTYYWNRWNRSDAPYTETKEFFPITPFSQDSLSALYFIRMQPLKNGDVFTFPVINEGKTWEAVITVLGREEMDTPMGKIRVIKLLPETKYQGILKKQGDSFLWLSDDDHKYLVKLEAKVKIGSVIGRLKSVSPGNAPAL